MADLHMIEQRLAAYLACIAAEGGFALGARDCCTLMADWLMRLGLPDVMADRRGAYATQREFRSLLRAEGGLVAACARRFAAAGLSIARAPRPGDVAVLLLPYRERRGLALRRPTGAIALSSRSFVALGSALLITRAEPAQVWTVNA